MTSAPVRTCTLLVSNYCKGGYCVHL